MMADRHTLHFNKLDSFKKWLIKNDWEMKPLSKSQYEVLRATKNGKWVIVYVKDEATEHYSLTENSISVVNQWLRERKIRKQVCDEIRKQIESLETNIFNRYKECSVVSEFDSNRLHCYDEILEILDQAQGE